MKYIYIGDVALDRYALDLLKVADYYQIDDLKHKCEKNLTESLSVENYIELLELADIFDASRLETKEIRFIIKNKKKLMKTK